MVLALHDNPSSSLEDLEIAVAALVKFLLNLASSV